MLRCYSNARRNNLCDPRLPNLSVKVERSFKVRDALQYRNECLGHRGSARTPLLRGIATTDHFTAYEIPVIVTRCRGNGNLSRVQQAADACEDRSAGPQKLPNESNARDLPVTESTPGARGNRPNTTPCPGTRVVDRPVPPRMV